MTSTRLVSGLTFGDEIEDYDYDGLQVTHNASPVTSLTIGGTVLKVSHDIAT